MLNNMRRKVANAISPDKSNTYPFVELNWKSDEDQIREGTAQAHQLYERENGRKASSDDEARAFSKNYYDELLGVK